MSTGNEGAFIQIPLEVLHDGTVSHAAKITYGRLLLYAGRDGKCNPAQETLAAEVRLRPRQVRTVLSELKERGWISWRRTRTSCWYEITGPFSHRQKTASHAPERQETATESGRKLPVRAAENCLQKDLIKDHRKENTENTDLDCQATNRKNRDSLPGAEPVPGTWKDLADLVENLLGRTLSRSSLGKIVESAPGQDPAKAAKAINSAVLRGYGSESKHRPHSVSWFVSVVQNHWAECERRGLPPAAPSVGMSTAELDRMTNAIELPEAS